MRRNGRREATKGGHSTHESRCRADGGTPSADELADRIAALEAEVQNLREIVTTLAVVNDLCPACERGELDVDWDDEVVRCLQCGEEWDLSDVAV